MENGTAWRSLLFPLTEDEERVQGPLLLSSSFLPDLLFQSSWLSMEEKGAGRKSKFQPTGLSCLLPLILMSSILLLLSAPLEQSTPCSACSVLFQQGCVVNKPEAALMDGRSQAKGKETLIGWGSASFFPLLPS